MLSSKLPIYFLATRASRVRGVLLLLVLFVTYFVAAKPALASQHDHATLKISAVETATEVSHDDSSIPESDCASVNLEMDDFLLAPIEFNFGQSDLVFEIQDQRMNLPLFDLGLDWPPESLV